VANRRHAIPKGPSEVMRSDVVPLLIRLRVVASLQHEESVLTIFFLSNLHSKIVTLFITEELRVGNVASRPSLAS